MSVKAKESTDEKCSTVTTVTAQQIENGIWAVSRTRPSQLISSNIILAVKCELFYFNILYI